jgi:hypothetical protein
MVLCKNSRESIEHLLLHCEEVETEMWSVILQLFCVDWAIPHNLRECWEVGGDNLGTVQYCIYEGWPLYV